MGIPLSIKTCFSLSQTKVFKCKLQIIIICSLFYGLAGCAKPDLQKDKGQANEIVFIDSVVSDFPVNFSFLNQGNWQFVGYYNKNRELTVASRKLQDSVWQYQVLPTKVGWDSHNRIVMAFDRENQLHVSANMHNDSMRYFKMQRPFDIKSLSQVFPLVNANDELRSTYPSFLEGPDKELVFSYRKGGSGNGITILTTYDEESDSFRRLIDVPLFDGLNEMSSYFSGPTLGPDRFYHLVWVWRDTPDAATNHDLSYGVSKDLIHWTAMDGTPMTLPITPNANQFVVDPVPAGGGAINGGYRLLFDKTNQPLIVFMKYGSQGKSQLFIAKPKNKKWDITQLTAWDHRWNIGGSGSIKGELKIKNAYLSDGGKIEITYWHIKKGDGMLIVDPANFNDVEDIAVGKIENSLFPSAYLKASRDSMNVHWLTPQNTSNQDINYVLRWETMGRRQFYEPRAEAIPPSALQMFALEESPKK